MTIAGIEFLKGWYFCKIVILNDCTQLQEGQKSHFLELFQKKRNIWTFYNFSLLVPELFLGLNKCTERHFSHKKHCHIVLHWRPINTQIYRRAYESHIYELNLLLKSSPLWYCFWFQWTKNKAFCEYDSFGANVLKTCELHAIEWSNGNVPSKQSSSCPHCRQSTQCSLCPSKLS